MKMRDFPIERISEFRYLGAVVKEDDRLGENVSSRIRVTLVNGFIGNKEIS